jgi:uncharacterized protein YndB with AHSA1/START domain
MSEPSAVRGTTRVSRTMQAPRSRIYAAFLDPDAVAKWLPPDSMTGAVHLFEPREGGRFRISLTYQDPANALPGKSSENTDTVAGKFAELIPDQQVVWLVEFESTDSAFGGEMRVTWTLADAGPGTEVTVLMENLPPGVRPEDNEAGSRSTLENLANYVERERPSASTRP